MNQFAYTFAFIAGFMGILYFSEFLHKRFRLNVEITRKLAHFTACMSSLAFVLVFDAVFYVVLMGIVFFTLLFLGKKYQLFDSIDKIERKSSGSYLLPVSIGMMFYISIVTANELYFVLPILILGICDPLAGLSGFIFHTKSTSIRIFHYTFHKTVRGSLLFMISAFILSCITLYLFQFNINTIFILSFSIALATTIAEFLSTGGIDNITIPATAAFTIWLS